MSRRLEEDLGSLDLLLDTICNAFGGIVFIALLLAILAREVSNIPLDAYEDGRLPPKVLRLTGEIRMLEDMIARLQERVTDEAESEEDLSENERELSRLSMELMEVQGISASQKKEISRLRAEITSNREQMQDLEERKRNLLVQSNRVGEGKRVEKRLPVASPTNPNMKQFWIFVTNQRLHLVDSLVSGEPYHSDVVILERGTSHTVVTVRNERGQPIRQGFEGQGKMAGFLNATSPQRVVVQAMVDKESFKEFNLVKEVLIQNGYRYFFDIGEVPIRFVHGSGSNFENF